MGRNVAALILRCLMERLPMCPVFQALLDAICTDFRSRLSLQLEVVALRHQLAVYQRSTKRLRIQAGTGFSGHGCLGIGEGGVRP